MPKRQQHFFASEVVQISEMDCGPASLKAVLEGYGISVSYGRLREACQTSVDGTSIDTIEEVANALGLDAVQIMVPSDHILLPEAKALPAIIVTRLPNGLTHFIVVWNIIGDFIQVMDPGSGRRWVTRRQLLDQLFIHQFPVSAAAWRAWAGTDDFLTPLRRRLLDLKIPKATSEGWISDALSTEYWRVLGSLDAATRLVSSLVRAKGILRGQEATRILEQFFYGGVGYAKDGAQALSTPMPFWSVWPEPPPVSSSVSMEDVAKAIAEHAQEEVTEIPEEYPPDAFEGEGTPESGVSSSEQASAPGSQTTGTNMPEDETVLLRGAVLVHILGRRSDRPPAALGEEEPAPVLSAELQAALDEPSARPDREIFKALKEDGYFSLFVLAMALGLATLGVTIQGLLFQGAIHLIGLLPQAQQQFYAIVAMVVFVFLLFLIEVPISSVTQRIGRRLETRMRVAFLKKIPRLGDRYFHSRLTSDMTQRAHDLRSLRTLPMLGVGLLRTFFQLLLTTAGVIWLQPESAAPAIVGVVVFVGLTFLSTPILEESDLRLRTHTGALSRFYLDALLGLIPLRLHGAERAFRRQHEGLLVEWIQANRQFARIGNILQSVQALFYSAFAVWILMSYLQKGGAIGNVLLLFYWTLNLPVLGQAMFQQAQQYPMLKNRILRLLEPLGAPDEAEEVNLADQGLSPEPEEKPDGNTSPEHGVRIAMEGLSVHAGGHTILEDINLQIAPGEHVGIVGPSGAGKSSLVGLLLGWHRPAAGRLLVDESDLDGLHLAQLRQQTAWVDPAVQLWNRTLLENLTYGNDKGMSQANLPIQEADLFGLFERLENGLQTPLGEAGGLVSGGEGQRVRLGRAMGRPGARLAILDEPFRGLDREKRRKLLAVARDYWKDATLICVTHDVGETLAFDRVIMIENGKIIEDDAPGHLATNLQSRYRALLDAEEAVQKGMWQSATWRRLWIENGDLREVTRDRDEEESSTVGVHPTK